MTQDEINRELYEFKGTTEQSIKNTEKYICNMEKNHLPHIYKRLQRPSWLVLIVISTLCSALTFVSSELIRQMFK